MAREWRRCGGGRQGKGRGSIRKEYATADEKREAAA
jgi:hypothetical protein